MPRTVFVSQLRNLGAFLDMTAVSELSQAIIDQSDDGYDVVVGSTAQSVLLFTPYKDHPRKMIQIRPGLNSDAAGRYQILSTYWPHYKAQLKLVDFSPQAQDAYAVQQIRERAAYDDVIAGRIGVAIGKCKNIWASFPGSGYGQHEHGIQDLLRVYQNAGGVLA